MKPEGIVNWYWFCVSGALAVAKLCKFRPSNPFSPKRELQGLVLGEGSLISPRRPSIRVERPASRSGERRSPKRGCDEVACVERDFSSRRGVYGFGRTRVSPRRDGLA